MKKPSNRDSKLKREGSSRKDRAMEDREVSQDRELTDTVRLDILRATMFQSALPDLPPIKGYHVCWLTTTNPRDPIHGRLRLGYELVKGSDIPGFGHSTVKSGEWEGCIGVNEMIAAKLPIHLYEMYMREVHHNEPLSQEEKLNEAMELAKEAAASRVGSRKARGTLVAEEGTEDLGQNVPEPPPFSETLGEATG